MTSETIATDAAFTEEERALIMALADLIIPASDDGRMPSAADFDVAAFVSETQPRQAHRIQADLRRLEEAAQESYGRSFLDLSVDERVAITDSLRESDSGFCGTLATATTICYYQQDQVLKAIGLPARPPYPEGFTVESGDLSLLDPVRERGQIYRDV